MMFPPSLPQTMIIGDVKAESNLNTFCFYNASNAVEKMSINSSRYSNWLYNYIDRNINIHILAHALVFGSYQM